MLAEPTMGGFQRPGSSAKGVNLAADLGSDPKLAPNQFGFGMQAGPKTNAKPVQCVAKANAKPRQSQGNARQLRSAAAAVALKSADLNTRLCERERVRNANANAKGSNANAKGSNANANATAAAPCLHLHALAPALTSTPALHIGMPAPCTAWA